MTDRLMSDLAESVSSNQAKDRMQRILSILGNSDPYLEGAAIPVPASTSMLATQNRRAYDGEEAAARAHVLADVASDLRLFRADVRMRSNRSFIFLVVFSCLTGASVLAAVGIGLAGAAGAAGLSSVGALLSGGAATAFWRLYIAETRRADTLMADLQKIEDARVAYLLAEPRLPARSQYTIKGPSGRSSKETR
jgi:hypothetical protein